MIDQHQNQLGVIPIEQALSLAREAGLDLVEVSPNEHPPVCRIIDYGKHMYEKKKRAKQAAQAHVTSLKEIRLRPKTDEHDRGIKLSHARDFLEEGHKVQFTMLFKGRERMFRERAIEIFNEMVTDLGELAKVERPAMMDGKRMTMVIGPGKRSGKPSGSSSGSSPTSTAASVARPPTPKPRPAEPLPMPDPAQSPQSM